MLKPNHKLQLPSGAVVLLLRKTNEAQPKWNAAYLAPAERVGETCAFNEKFLIFYARPVPGWDASAFFAAGGATAGADAL